MSLEEIRRQLEELRAANNELSQKIAREHNAIAQSSVPAVNLVAVKLPPFLADRPSLWFSQADSQFIISGKTCDDTKFHYVVAQLDTRYATEVEDIITSPPEMDKYQVLRTKLIQCLSASEKQRVQQFISDEEYAVARSSWINPLVTQKDAPACPQPFMEFSEDCLYLNVFTPLNASSTPGKYPVITFIHGSGFTEGSSNTKVYGPDFLVAADVILVTMNYRLGAAGFMTLASEVAPGNLGVYDTKLALQWVQDEIFEFGGDPNQVTLMGQSTGSATTLFHYLSPSSSGLFKQAIAQSASVLSPGLLITADEGRRRTSILAEAVNCNSSQDDAAILSCLQKVNINYIVGNQSIQLPINALVSGRHLRFVPILDTSFTKTPFFNDSIPNLMQTALERAKPLVSGFNPEDGILVFSKPWWKQMQDNLAGFIPDDTLTLLNEDSKTLMINRIKNQYFQNTITDNKVLDMVNIYTDFIFAHPIIEVVRYFSQFTYGYVFVYNGAWATVPHYFSQFKVTGVGHGAELKYLFYSSDSRSQDLHNCPSNQQNLNMRNNMIKWWTTFAKTGVPDPLWKPVAAGSYLKIDSTTSFVNTSEVETQHFTFWENLTQTTFNSCNNENLNRIVILIAVACTNSIQLL